MMDSNAYKENMLQALQGKLSEDAYKHLMEAIQHSADLKAEWLEMQKIYGEVQSIDYDFSPFFSQKVLNRLAEMEGQKVGLKLWSSYKWVTVPALAAALGFLIMIAYQEQQIDFDTLAGMEEMALEDVMIRDWEDLP